MIVKLLREGLGRLIILGDTLTRPKPVERSAEQQAQVDEAVKQMSLYQFYACPFCTKTRRAIRRLALPIEVRDAKCSPFRQELEAGGGRIKVPCLRIESDSGEVQWMYESNDIIAYLENRFAVSPSS